MAGEFFSIQPPLAGLEKQKIWTLFLHHFVFGALNLSVRHSAVYHSLTQRNSRVHVTFPSEKRRRGWCFSTSELKARWEAVLARFHAWEEDFTSEVRIWRWCNVLVRVSNFLRAFQEQGADGRVPALSFTTGSRVKQMKKEYTTLNLIRRHVTWFSPGWSDVDSISAGTDLLFKIFLSMSRSFWMLFVILTTHLCLKEPHT